MSLHIKSLIVLLISMFFCKFPLPVSAEHTVNTNIPYIAGNTPKQQLDIYVPEEKPNKPLPVHVYVHGGAWTIGDKRHVVPKRAHFYTDKDIILVALNYRLSPAIHHPAHIQDIAAATHWIVQHIQEYGGDPTNMVLSGHSAGAHLVALLGTHPNYLAQQSLPQTLFKAIVPVDTAAYNLTLPPGTHERPLITRMKQGAFGTDPNTLTDASPIHQVRPNVTLSPFHLFVTHNRPEAVSQTSHFAQALQLKGHSVKSYVLQNGETHRQMNLAIFKDSDISSEILKSLLAE
ncbi:MAG: alpha/beta hydrolase [Vampirovibrio sp.]|nr:alpha/beta hydrolase [Vampirovibrio sp.]